MNFLPITYLDLSTWSVRLIGLRAIERVIFSVRNTIVLSEWGIEAATKLEKGISKFQDNWVE